MSKISHSIETGTPCPCCRAPYPARHNHRNCSDCDAVDEALELGEEPPKPKKKKKK